MNLDALTDRFGATRAEPIHAGFSEATVVRLDSGPDRLYYKTGGRC
ncbi:hypothetical protein [Kribbella sp. NPDC055071]